MSIYGKRTAASPKENMSKKGSGQNFETDLDTLVKLEFLTINERPFYGQISDDELLYLWVTVFERKSEELFGVTSTRSLTRNVRATFKLNELTKLTDIYKTAEFSYEKFLDDGASEIITGRILGHGNLKPAEIGGSTVITVRTGFGVEAAGVVNWLKLYATVTGKPEFVINKTTGLRTDTVKIEVVLRKHIEEYLPMFGQKVLIHYPGIPKQCNRCYQSGHMRKECNNPKKDWIVYVNDLVENGVAKELIGTWKNAIERWKSANQPVRPNPK
jgi:hypothetical protein